METTVHWCCFFPLTLNLQTRNQTIIKKHDQVHLNPLAQISKFKFSKLISIQLLKDLVEEI